MTKPLIIGSLFITLFYHFQASREGVKTIRKFINLLMIFNNFLLD